MPSRMINADRTDIRLLGQKHSQGRDSPSTDYLEYVQAFRGLRLSYSAKASADFGLLVLSMRVESFHQAS